MSVPRQTTGSASRLAVLGAVVTTVANFAIAYLVSQESAELAGVFFVATAIATIAGNSSSLGTMTGLVYFMPRAVSESGAGPRSLLLTALRPVILVSLCVSLVVIAGAGPIARLVASEAAADVETMLRIVALAVPAWAVTASLLGATRGLGSHTPTVLVGQVIRPGLQIVALAAVFIGGSPSVDVIAVAWAFPVIVASGAALVAVIRLGGFESTDGQPVASSEYWSYTRPRALSTSLQIALERIDVVLVGAFVGTAGAGVYGALTRFISAGNFLMFSVAQAVSPGLRRAIAGEAWPAARATLQKATAWLVLIAWPYFLVVGLKSETLAGLLSDEYVADAGILLILAAGMMFSAYSGPIELALLMLGRSGLALVGVSLAIVADVLLLVALTPSLGLEGAALAWSASVVIQNSTAAWFVRRETSGSSIGPLLAPSRRSAVAAAIAVAAVVPIALITPDSIGGLAVVAVVAAPLLLGLSLAASSTLALTELVPARLLPKQTGADHSGADPFEEVGERLR